MAKHLILVKRGLSFVPANPFTAELMDGLPNDEREYSVDLKISRSRGELNLYWAGLGLLVNNFNEADHAKWPTSERYSQAMLIAFGHTYRLWRLDGSYRDIPDSIALDKMEADEFKEFFENVRAATVSLFGYDPWDEWAEKKTAQRQRYMAMRRNWYPGAKDDL